VGGLLRHGKKIKVTFFVEFLTNTLLNPKELVCCTFKHFSCHYVFRRVLKIAKSDYQLHVCPSVHMEQLGSHWTDFNEVLYLNICGKSVQHIKVSLKSDKNKEYFT